MKERANLGVMILSFVSSTINQSTTTTTTVNIGWKIV